MNYFARRTAGANTMLTIAAMICLSFAFTASGSKPKHIMGRVSECQSGYLKIGSTVLLMTPSTEVTNQSNAKIELAKIGRRDLVYITFRRYAKKLVAEKIQLLDQAIAKKQQSFRGLIRAAKGNRFLLEETIFNFDEFTIRVGETLEKDAGQDWRGANAIVIATEKAPGLWMAEFIREDLETTAMAQ